MRSFRSGTIGLIVGIALVLSAPRAEAQHTDAPSNAGASTTTASIVDWFLAQRQIGLVRPSPDGRYLAVEVRRPLSTRARRGGIDGELRTDLFLIETSSGRVRQLTFGDRTAAGHWAPIWSPDSRKLALLTNAGDGGVRAGLIDVATSSFRLLSDRPVDVQVNFGSESAFEQGRVWGAWTSPTHFIAAFAEPGYVDLMFDSSAPELVYAPRWTATQEGRTSVTVWDSATNPTCGRDRTLALLDTSAAARARAQQTIATGAMRAVTLAPNRDLVAIVEATRARPAPGDAAATFEPDYLAYNLDPRVETSLALVRIDDAAASALPANSGGFRFQTSADGAQFSTDGRTIFAPRYDTPGQSSTNHAVVAFAPAFAAGSSAGNRPGASTTRSFPVRSRFHARILALALSRGGEANTIAASLLRLGLDAPEPGLFAGQSTATIARLGEDFLAIAAPNTLAVLDLRTGAIVHERPQQASAFLAGASTRYANPGDDPTPAALLQAPNGFWLTSFVDQVLSLKKISPPSTDAFPLAITPRAHTIIWSTPARDTLWLTDSQTGVSQEILSLRQEPLETFGQLSQQIFRYRLPDGTPANATLLLPPNYDPRRRYPLIIDAYPGVIISDEAATRRLPTDSIAYLDPIAFASAGFVVATPSIPDSFIQSSPSAPLERLSLAVEALADAVLTQGVGQSGAIGVYGHSNGGYTSLAVAARTRRINAIVASSPFADLIGANGRPFTRGSVDECAPNRYFGATPRFTEDPDGPLWRLGAPPHLALERYIANSPLYQLNRTAPPTLIVQGEFDSIGTADSEKTYIRLARLGVPVQLARYWGEDHVFDGPGNIHDRIERELQWFRTHLADNAVQTSSSNQITSSRHIGSAP